MSNPLVCCIMLVNGRKAMVNRALRAFKEQTYDNAVMILWDNSVDRTEPYALPDHGVWYIEQPNTTKKTVGELRNDANAWAMAGPSPLPDIFMHWDSDDWSHPRRIEEQVAFLKLTGADAVGFRDMLFWRTVQLTERDVYGPEGSAAPCDVLEQAWRYRHRNSGYCLGTSLCYWSRVWNVVRFLHMPTAVGSTGEEYYWLKRVRAVGSSSFGPDISLPPEVVPVEWDGYTPRMIASIHGNNTQYYGEDMLQSYAEFERVPGWDEHCRKVMAL